MSKTIAVAILMLLLAGLLGPFLQPDLAAGATAITTLR
jgi:hypothetical protein